MAEQKHYISQYRASNGTVFLLKDREVREALKSKANAASLGVATKRIDDLEDEKASKAELAEALTGADILDKTTRQLAVMYFLPPYSEGKVYQKDMIIRMDGRVFKSLTDGNTACPYTVLTNDEGTIIVNDNWEALILDNVMEQNWAQLDETLIPTTSIPDRMTVVETKVEEFESSAMQSLQTLQTQLTSYQNTKQSQLTAFVNNKESELTAYTEQKIAEMDASTAAILQEYQTTITEANALIQQQATIIQNLTARLAYLDNLTIMVSDNRNDSDSYTDNQ